MQTKKSSQCDHTASNTRDKAGLYVFEGMQREKINIHRSACFYFPLNWGLSSHFRLTTMITLFLPLLLLLVLLLWLFGSKCQGRRILQSISSNSNYYGTFPHVSIHNSLQITSGNQPMWASSNGKLTTILCHIVQNCCHGMSKNS